MALIDDALVFTFREDCDVDVLPAAQVERHSEFR